VTLRAREEDTVSTSLQKRKLRRIVTLFVMLKYVGRTNYKEMICYYLTLKSNWSRGTFFFFVNMGLLFVPHSKEMQVLAFCLGILAPSYTAARAGEGFRPTVI
jgi:hypothetical protein